MEKLNVSFLADYEVKDELRTKYLAGQVVPMTPASAYHFVNRGVAVIQQAKTGKRKAGK